eukprot:3929656-Rhodomonas_salina.3
MSLGNVTDNSLSMSSHVACDTEENVLIATFTLTAPEVAMAPNIPEITICVLGSKCMFSATVK